eukprot:556226_1
MCTVSYHILALIPTIFYCITDAQSLAPTASPTYPFSIATTTTATAETYALDGNTLGGNTFEYTKIQCNLEECYINCDPETGGYQKCDGLVIDASRSAVLDLKCGSYVCDQITIEHGATNYNSISCTGDNSCSYSSFTIENANTVNLTCNHGTQSGSCVNSDFYLYNIQLLKINVSNGGTISRNMMLNGTQSVEITANSANLWGDWYLDNVAEFKLNANGKDSVYVAEFYAQNIATNAIFEINCHDAESCWHSYIWLPQEDKNVNVSLSCNSDNACDRWYFYIPSIAYNIQLNCATDTLQTSCIDTTFFCMDTQRPTGKSSDMNIGAINYNSTLNKYICEENYNGCCPIQYKSGSLFDSGDMQYNNMEYLFICDGIINDCKSSIINLTNIDAYVTINCTSYSSCEDMVIYGPQGVNTKLIVYCYGFQSCKGSYIDGRYTLTTEIYCNGNEACSLQHVLYPNIDYQTNFNSNVLTGLYKCNSGANACAHSIINANGITNMTIDCTGIDSTNENDAKCLEIYGSIRNSQQVNIYCGSNNDCQDSYWELKQGTTALFNCSGINSCRQIKVYGFDAESLSFNCVGYASCLFGSFQCPSINEQICNFECRNDFSCYGIHIYSAKNWVLQYLNINCNDQTGDDICTGPIEILCPFDVNSPQIEWGYNINCSNNNYCCQSKQNQDKNNNIECCPFGTLSPTLSPTGLSLTPTVFPSSAPTLNNTYEPSQTPTDHPIGTTFFTTFETSYSSTILRTDEESTINIVDGIGKEQTEITDEPWFIWAVIGLGVFVIIIMIAIFIICRHRHESEVETFGGTGSNMEMQRTNFQTDDIENDRESTQIDIEVKEIPQTATNSEDNTANNEEMDWEKIWFE